MVFHISTPRNPKARFKVSHLCYASIKQPQYEATVKLLGSFRLIAGRGHLHPHCIFTEQVLETVSQSLRHSCTSELTRQGIALFFLFIAEGLYLHPFYNGFAPHLRVGGILISQNKIRTCDIWSLDGHIVDYTYITARKVAMALNV